MYNKTYEFAKLWIEFECQVCPDLCIVFMSTAAMYLSLTGQVTFKYIDSSCNYITLFTHPEWQLDKLDCFRQQ